MDYYQHNLIFLKEKAPDLAQRLDEVKPIDGVELSKSLLPEGANFSEVDTVVVFGFGLHVLELAAGTTANILILVIEPDLARFKTFLTGFDFTPAFKENRLVLAVGEPPEQVAARRLEAYYGLLTGSKIQIIEDSTALQSFPEYFQIVKKNLAEVMDTAARNLATLQRFAGIWQHNILANLKAILENPGWDTLFGKFKGKPVIICGAGPSLDKNVKSLSQAKGKALIICVDTALRTLLTNHIQPDLVVAIDAGEANYCHFEGLDTSGIALAADAVTYPAILADFKGTVFIGGYGNPLMQWLEQFIGSKGQTTVGGSVATTAFDLARKLGGAPIIFVGLDLAFSGGRFHTVQAKFEDNETFLAQTEREVLEESRRILKKMAAFSDLASRYEDFCHRRKRKLVTYKTGIYLEDTCPGEPMANWLYWLESWMMIPERIVWVEDNSGNLVMSSPKFDSWRRWIEARILSAGVKCINATEGGAKIKGAEVMALRSAIAAYCAEAVDAGEVLQAIQAGYHPPPLVSLKSALADLSEEAKRINLLAGQGVRMAESLIIAFRTQGEASSPRARQIMSRLLMFYQDIVAQPNFVALCRWQIESLLSQFEFGSDEVNPDKARTYQSFFIEIEKMSGELSRQLENANRELLECSGCGL